jgi:hypothetical protein
VKPFEETILKRLANILGDTNTGLTSTEIGEIFADLEIPDPTPALTKRTRLLNAWLDLQATQKSGDPVVAFVDHATGLNFAHRWRNTPSRDRRLLNEFLAHCGKLLSDAAPPTTSAACNGHPIAVLLSELQRRHAHTFVLTQCGKAGISSTNREILKDAAATLKRRIRQLAGKPAEGPPLLGVFYKGDADAPALRINNWRTPDQHAEQRGIAEIVAGIFRMLDRPQGSSHNANCPADELDALDVLSIVSFVHRKLDGARSGSGKK